MEQRFGRDFGQIQLHTDQKAADSARSVHSRAYTVGQHIVFGTGEYQPASMAGRRLLAHELTHSLQQQSHRGTPRVQRQGNESTGGHEQRQEIDPLPRRFVEGTASAEEQAELRARVFRQGLTQAEADYIRTHVGAFQLGLGIPFF